MIHYLTSFFFGIESHLYVFTNVFFLSIFSKGVLKNIFERKVIFHNDF